jgi:hypothetical protein
MASGLVEQIDVSQKQVSSSWEVREELVCTK